jgi:tRNA(adenine34) deaminase
MDVIVQPDMEHEDNAVYDATDLAYMGRALDWAKKGEVARGGNPIGCVIVLDGKIVGEGFNECEIRCDPTSHAEIVAIRRACEVLQTTELRGATLYSTLQPCGMCSMASIWAKISRIIYGAGREDVHEMYFEERDRGTVDYLSDAYRDDLSLLGGVMAKECAALYVGPNENVPVENQVNL